MSTTTTSHASSPSTNLVVLVGASRRPATVRTLPDGREVVQFDLDTTLDSPDGPVKRSVPVAWFDPSDRERRVLDADGRLLIVGAVERRFFRVGGQTQSRTEVVARQVIPTRRSATAARVLEEWAGLVSRVCE